MGVLLFWGTFLLLLLVISFSISSMITSLKLKILCFRCVSNYKNARVIFVFQSSFKNWVFHIFYNWVEIVVNKNAIILYNVWKKTYSKSSLFQILIWPCLFSLWNLLYLLKLSYLRLKIVWFSGTAYFLNFFSSYFP